ncbi:MAG: hypothetical protein KF886_12195 [Candidatus Hydrogenedentes bacterium]|nr:hypothetical protein [Candidatus Hydrogenedentota bacterium]
MARWTGLLLAAALSCLPAPGQSQNEHRSLLLHGVVRDRDGAPAAGAEVRCWWMPVTNWAGALIPTEGPPAITDEEGRYRYFVRQPPIHGPGFLSIQHPDAGLLLTNWEPYAARPYVGARRESDLAAIPNPEPVHFSIHKLPERTEILGTVTTHEGAPAAGARVMPILAIVAPGGKSAIDKPVALPYDLAAILSAQTGQDGRFTIQGMPAGAPFALRAWSPDAGAVESGLDTGGQAFPPLLHRRGEAAPNLQLPAPGAVVGRAVYYDGTELPEDVRIKAMRMGFPWGESVHATPDATGEFRLEPLAAGPWGIFVDSSPYNSAPVNVEVTPGEHTKAQVIVVGPGATIAGSTVHSEMGDLVKGTELAIELVYEQEEIVPLAVRFEAGDINLRARPGVVSVHVRGLNCTVIDAPKAQWLLAHGAHYPDFTISVLPHTRFSGRVIRAGGAPATGAAVRSMGFHVRTDASGDFTMSIPALPPNQSQRFHATHAWTETEFGHLDVSAESPASGLTIQLAEAGSIVGRIEDLSQTPNVPRQVALLEGNELRAVTWTGEGGRFRFDVAPPGLELSLLIQGGESCLVPPIEPGETRDMGEIMAHADARPFLPQPKIDITPPLEEQEE